MNAAAATVVASMGVVLYWVSWVAGFRHRKGEILRRPRGRPPMRRPTDWPSVILILVAVFCMSWGGARLARLTGWNDYLWILVEMGLAVAGAAAVRVGHNWRVRRQRSRLNPWLR